MITKQDMLILKTVGFLGQRASTLVAKGLLYEKLEAEGTLPSRPDSTRRGYLPNHGRGPAAFGEVGR
jgi:hypothetical protein